MTGDHRASAAAAGYTVRRTSSSSAAAAAARSGPRPSSAGAITAIAVDRLRRLRLRHARPASASSSTRCRSSARHGAERPRPVPAGRGRRHDLVPGRRQRAGRRLLRDRGRPVHPADELDLPATTLRGYVQVETAGRSSGKHVALTYPDGTPILDNAGAPGLRGRQPAVPRARSSSPRRTARSGSSSTTTPPRATGGNLFLPVDTTIMGAGMGPNGGTVLAEPGDAPPARWRDPVDQRRHP